MPAHPNARRAMAVCPPEQCMTPLYHEQEGEPFRLCFVLTSKNNNLPSQLLYGGSSHRFARTSISEDHPCPDQQASNSLNGVIIL